MLVPFSYIIVLFAYLYILQDQNIKFKDKSIILTYSFFSSLIAIIGMIIIESIFAKFWSQLYLFNFELYLIVIVLIEEIFKFLFIPLFSKNILIIDKISIMTALSFSILENILWYLRNESLSIFIYRFLAITPIHIFLGFLYYYLFFMIQKRKLNYIYTYSIPFITTFVHFFVNYFILGTPRYIVFIYSACAIIFSFIIAQKYMFGRKKTFFN